MEDKEFCGPGSVGFGTNIETTAIIMGWPTRKLEFSQTSDDTLDIVVRSVLSVVVLGALRGRGLLVQRNRGRPVADLGEG